MTRRSFLPVIPAPLLEAQSAADGIVAVKAAPLPLLPTSRFGSREFKDDRDPQRWRWFGPFSQLAGSILVQIRTKSGLTGYGMGGGGTASIHVIENHLKDLLIGADPGNMDLLWDQMFASSSFYGRRGLPVMAISGIDLALWDIAGKRANKPVWQLLNQAGRDSVASYYTGTDVRAAVDLGFKAIKFGVLADLSNDAIVGMLRDGRSAVGTSGAIMLDMLCRWDVERSLRFCRQAADLRLYFLEEPLLPDDIEGYARLCREVNTTKIASGEHEFTHYGFAEIIRNRASHILQPDLTWAGGLTAGRRIVALANKAGVPVLPHRCGSVFAIHLAIANAEIAMAESFGTGEPGNEMMQVLTPPFKRGRYLAPTKPGIGADLTDALLKRFTPALV
jgi:L-rhamnonate dehydratase